MAKEVSSLLVRIGADVSGLARGVSQGAQALESLNAKASVAGRTLAALGSVLATGAVIGFAKNMFNNASAMAEAADRAGIAIESLSRLKYVAGQSNVEFEALTSSVQKMQIALSKAVEGSNEQSKIFASLGVEASKLRGMQIEDQLGEIANAFARMKDPTDQTRFAVQIFGESAGPKLLPLLRQGKQGIAELTAEADRLGVTMSGVAAQGINEADKAMKRLIATVEGFGTKMVAGLSLAIFGPSDELLKLDDKIRSLQTQRDSILSSSGGNPLGIQKAQVAELNAEIEKLLAKQREMLGLVTRGDLGSGRGGRGGPMLLEDDPVQEVDVSATIGRPMDMSEGAKIAMEAEKELAELMEKIKEDQARKALEAEIVRLQEEWKTRTQIESESMIASNELLAEIEQQGMDTLYQIRAEGLKNMEAVTYSSFQKQAKDSAKFLADMTAGVARESKAMFELNKVAAIANALLDMREAVSGAYKVGARIGGPPLGAAFAAAAGAAQLAQINAIRQQSFNGGGGATAAAPSVTGTPATPVTPVNQPAPQTFIIEGMDPGSMFSGRAVRELLERIEEASRDGSTKLVFA